MNEELIKILIKKLAEDNVLDDLRGLVQKEEREISKVDELKKAYKVYNDYYEFDQGDIVQWKEGMKNKKVPLYDEPAIVIEVLKEPVLNRNVEAGSPYFRESYDIILGIISSRKELIFFHYDSKRFKPYKQ